MSFRLHRRRRRPWASLVLVSAVVAIVVALVIGGLLHVGTASTPYWRAVDRSYAAGGRTLALQSNQTGAQLMTLMKQMPTLQSRQELQAQLDGVVQSASQTATAASALVPPSPQGDVAENLTNAFAGRARAIDMVRGAVYGVLGMGPLPVPGTPASPSATHTSVLLSTSQAAAQLSQAATVLDQANRSYALARHELAAGPGGGQLPRSVWVLRPGIWATPSLQALVSQVTGAPDLAAVHYVVLGPNTVTLSPPPVPSPTVLPVGVSVLVPTSTVMVTLAVDNQGNVAEPHVVVSATMTPAQAGGGPPSAKQTVVALGLSGTRVVTLGPLRVRPGFTYTLTVGVQPPAGQSNRNGTSAVFTLQIAPGTPPTTTTTTTTTKPTSTTRPGTPTTRPGTPTTRPVPTTKPSTTTTKATART